MNPPLHPSKEGNKGIYFLIYYKIYVLQSHE